MKGLEAMSLSAKEVETSICTTHPGLHMASLGTTRLSLRPAAVQLLESWYHLFHAGVAWENRA